MLEGFECVKYSKKRNDGQSNQANMPLLRTVAEESQKLLDHADRNSDRLEIDPPARVRTFNFLSDGDGSRL